MVDLWCLLYAPFLKKLSHLSVGKPDSCHHEHCRYVIVFFIQENPGPETSWRLSFRHLFTYLQILNDFPAGVGTRLKYGRDGTGTAPAVAVETDILTFGMHFNAYDSMIHAAYKYWIFILYSNILYNARFPRSVMVALNFLEFTTKMGSSTARY